MIVWFPWTTNSTLSPTLRPNRVRTLFGTVTCPFVLMTLEFAISLPSIPKVRIAIPTFQVNLTPESRIGDIPYVADALKLHSALTLP